MPLYKTNAINLKTYNIGEADKVITLFSREYGKIRAVAKGARRTASKFGGRLEIFTYNNLLLATGKKLDIISQCETIQSFYKIRESIEQLKTGVYFIKLIDLTTEDRQRNEMLFDLLLDSLNLLQTTKNMSQLARLFEVKLIEVEGLFPDIEKLHASDRVKTAILDLKNNGLNNDINESSLKNISILFKRFISDHIGRDLNKIKTGNF